MKNLTKTLLSLVLIIFFLTHCRQRTSESESNLTVFKGATIYDGNGNSYEDGVLIMEDGKIRTIGTGRTSIPEGAEIIDLTGKFIIPGMVDAHIHFFQTGFFDSRPDALDLRDALPYEEVQQYQRENPDRYFKAYLGSGVTAVYDVGGPPSSIKLQTEFKNDRSAPHIAASGILITPASEERIATFNSGGEQIMAHLGSDSVGRSTVKAMSDLGSTGIKIWALQPNNSDFMRRMQAVKDEIEKNNNKMIAHATTLEQAKAAVELGTKLLVHSVSDQMVDNVFIQMLKTNDVIYTPTLVVGYGYFNTYNIFRGMPFEINDSNGLVDPKTRELLEGALKYRDLVDVEELEAGSEPFQQRLDRSDSINKLNLKALYDHNVLIAVGTDAGNPGTLHGISIFDELEAMQDAGIPAIDLITMATRNGAMAMDRGQEIGTLEKGKIADLVILDRDPAADIANMRSITHVMRGGLLQSVEEISSN